MNNSDETWFTAGLAALGVGIVWLGYRAHRANARLEQLEFDSNRSLYGSGQAGEIGGLYSRVSDLELYAMQPNAAARELFWPRAPGLYSAREVVALAAETALTERR